MNQNKFFMKKNNTTEKQLANIEESLSKTEQYIEKNSKNLSFIIGFMVLLFIGIYSYKNLYIKPLNQSAQDKLFVAEQYFENNQFEEALNGNNEFDGFLLIMDEYSNTQSGKLARYYSGVCYLKTGNFIEAIKTLEKYTSKDKLMLSISKMSIGDAFVELNQPKEAIEYYEKALSINNNDVTSPIILMKCAKLYQKQLNHKKAVKLYNQIKNDYPNSNISKSIEKYINSVQLTS